MTLAECAGRAAAALAQAGFGREESHREVSVLARHQLGWDVATWLTRQQDEAPESLRVALEPLVQRRASGEPIAYLVGGKEFYGRVFTVTPDVLIPRPETELLVELSLERIDRQLTRAPHASVIDVGTGSGCIAVTVAAERRTVHVFATDTSAAAIAVARSNAASHGVAARITFLPTGFSGGTADADLIAANPPYVAEAERSLLVRDVRDFEPPAALFAGPDGLDVIRILVPDAFSALKGGGVLAMEIGAGQADTVAMLMAQAGFTAIQTHSDLAGIARVIEGTRPGRSV